MNKLAKCLCCDSNELEPILNLGSQPLANSYHNGSSLESYPLELNLCSTCWHLQLAYAIDPDLMFKEYLYVSGTSNTLKKYFEWFVDFVLTYNSSASKVLDIACNDGTQLDFFKNKGLKTYGIDPALNLLPISTKKGHRVVGEYFTNESINKLEQLEFDVITAQNVFAHNTYPLEFLKVCKNILSKTGHIFIQTSQADMVINNEFDTIYHEHISFFSIYSMLYLVERSGLYLNDVIKTDIHGNSYVFVISKNNKQEKSVQEELNRFIVNNLNSTLRYKEYAKSSYKVVKDLKNKILEYRNNGHLIVGYGAAAKGNTLLNFGKIELDFIIDDNPLKQNLLTPGMDILIKPLEYLNEIHINKPVVFIPLAWNFYSEIKKNIETVRKTNNIFVKYFPELNIE